MKSLSRCETRMLGGMMFVAGFLMALLPVVTWQNSVLLAVLLSPGIPMGIYLVWAGWMLAWKPDA
ncbi:hypothetical protein [Haloferula rosea]|uniref:Uncharacterized protein n=1 Tax=Haloferula rosea TaxID=490093 RepID=A0A934RFY5_9BACT|nr:hypothetical protein [Haloferula rosea]MBK1828868.1 hypothetical protein [Haloferula rosea]